MIGPSRHEENVRRFFSGFAEEWDTLYGGKRNTLWRLFDHTFRRDIYERYEITFERLGIDLSGKTILDIGCGSGVYCVEAARRGAAKIVGIDMSEEMVALAKNRSQELGYGDICEFIYTRFPPERPIQALEQTCDYAIVMGVMDYVSDPETFMGRLRPLITRFAVVSFPGQHWLRGPLRRYRYKVLGRCDVFTYDERSIREVCRAAGFARVDIQRLDHSGVCHIATLQA